MRTLSPAQRALIYEIAGRFLSSGKGTPERELEQRFGEQPGVVSELVALGFLTEWGDRYFPAFPSISTLDGELQSYVRGCTAVTLEALRRLFLVKENKRFDFNEVLKAARAVDSGASVHSVNVGIMMGFSFGELITGGALWGTDMEYDGDIVGSVLVGERIRDYVSLEAAWERALHRRQIRIGKLQLIGESASELADLPSRLVADPAEEITCHTEVEFSFVVNQKLRAIVKRDYQELKKIAGPVATKSRIILVGGLIEALLLDALKNSQAKIQSSQKASKEPLEEWGLSRLIEVALDIGLISPGVDKLSHGVREFRNLVHPGLEVSSSLVVDTHEANIAEEILNIVIRDLQKKKAAL